MQNTGHGHVFPRPDGLRARCGGPGMCSECSKDAAHKKTMDDGYTKPLPTPAEPTNEALIRDYRNATISYARNGTDERSARMDSHEHTLRTRLAALTERAEKAEAECFKLAANQCVVGKGLLLDEFGNTHCPLRAELARTREALTRTTVSLIAAISLLKGGGKKAAASDKMFEQMLRDYQRAVDLGCAALAKPEPADG